MDAVVEGNKDQGFDLCDDTTSAHGSVSMDVSDDFHLGMDVVGARTFFGVWGFLGLRRHLVDGKGKYIYTIRENV